MILKTRYWRLLASDNLYFCIGYKNKLTDLKMTMNICFIIERLKLPILSLARNATLFVTLRPCPIMYCSSLCSRSSLLGTCAVRYRGRDEYGQEIEEDMALEWVHDLVLKLPALALFLSIFRLFELRLCEWAWEKSNQWK